MRVRASVHGGHASAQLHSRDGLSETTRNELPVVKEDLFLRQDPTAEGKGQDNSRAGYGSGLERFELLQPSPFSPCASSPTS